MKKKFLRKNFGTSFAPILGLFSCLLLLCLSDIAWGQEVHPRLVVKNQQFKMEKSTDTKPFSIVQVAIPEPDQQGTAMIMSNSNNSNAYSFPNGVKLVQEKDEDGSSYFVYDCRGYDAMEKSFIAEQVNKSGVTSKLVSPIAETLYLHTSTSMTLAQMQEFITLVETKLKQIKEIPNYAEGDIKLQLNVK